MNTIVNIGDKVQFTNREIVTFNDEGAALLEIDKIYTIKKTNAIPSSKANPNLLGYRYVCLEEIPDIWFDKVLFKQLDNKRELNIIGIYKSNNDLDKIDFQVYYDDKLVSDVVFTCDILEFRNSVNSENVIKVSYYEDNLCKSCIINTKGKHFPYES